MPAIYEPCGAERFELCHPTHQRDFETLNVLIDGTPRSTTWRSPPMRLFDKDEGQPLLEADSPWLGSHALIFRRPALGELEALLLSCGELLPLDCAVPDLFIYNPTRVLDALDEQASEVERLDSGAIWMIDRHVFRPEVIAGVDVFKLACLRCSPTYVSDRFVERFKAAGLRGLVFDKVWSGP